MAATQRYDVKDLALAEEGKRRIEWADRQMPVLAAIRERFEREQPLAGHRISACLHVTTETANLMRTLQAGGATSSSARRIRFDAGRRRGGARAEYDVSVFAIKGEDNDTYYAHIEARRPQAALHDGRRRRRDRRPPLGAAGAARRDHRRHRGDDDRRDPAQGARGRGQARLPDHRGQRGADEALFDNRYGTGQSTIDGSSARRTSSSPASASSSAATAGSGAASPRGPAAWART
jgi:S-adenosylhomocysteine hydrolase